MKRFSPEMVDLATYLSMAHKPDKNNLLAVLRREKPARHTLFEFFLNNRLYADATADLSYDEADPFVRQRRMADSFYRLGYDYLNLYGNNMRFPTKQMEKSGASTSMNAHAVITDRDSFSAYEWPDPWSFSMERLDVVREHLHPDMAITTYCPAGGMLEALIELVGYENLCYLLVDDPDLVREVTDAIGERLLVYYERCAKHPAVDALIVNDDWGFNKQTMLSTQDMHSYIIPWHKRIAEVIHASGKPALLHSCGNLATVMDDIIDGIGYQAKHSYEDKILPVEDAYEQMGSRIAILGGLDVDFVIRAEPEQVYLRACRMLERTRDRGGYALGTGNSVPEYVPTENYLAMIAAAVFNR